MCSKYLIRVILAVVDEVFGDIDNADKNILDFTSQCPEANKPPTTMEETLRLVSYYSSSDEGSVDDD